MYNKQENYDILDKLKQKLDLPLKENIPQGEYFPCIYEFEHLINGKVKIFSISRYGTPNVFDHEIIRYDNYRTLFSNKMTCIFDKYDCEGPVEKVIAGDYDDAIHVCEKHKYIGTDFIDINVANIRDVIMFFSDYTQLRMAGKTNDKKITLLKKIKIIIDLAFKGKFKNFELNKDFELYGIHFYDHKFDHKNKNGWALLYYDYINCKIAHIFLDELTDDINVKNALVLFSYEIITARQEYNISAITSFIKHNKKAQYNQLIKAHKRVFNFNVPQTLHYKLL